MDAHTGLITQMNTQLKKGDKCNSPLGKVEVLAIYETSVDVKTDNGEIRFMQHSELTRIPTHAERMQAMLDIAWDSENRLEPHETVQLKVGAFVEFARHYYEMQQELLECVNYYKSNAKSSLDVAESIEKLLKGEML
jgi:hypothetical protein